MKKSQETQTKNKNNAGFMLLVILLVAVIAVSSSIGLYAWAKYRSNMNGTANAQVAKWHFEIRPGVTAESEPRVFGMTRTDGYVNVADEVLAPGTFGVIPIYVDTTGTEVLMRLDLTIKVTDCPRNIKFYSDSNRQEEIEVEKTQESGKYVSTVRITKYYAKDNHTQAHDETIYWGWDYLTYDENNSTASGNARDNEDNGKVAQIVIMATGTQVLEEPSSSLAARVNVGDYVNYDPGNHSISNNDLSDLDGVSLNGSISTGSVETPVKVAQTTGLEGLHIGEVEDDGTMKWRVLSVDENTGVVQLVADRPTSESVELYGENGYMNAIEGLDRVAGIYGHGKGATGARSITVEDVNKVEGFDASQYDSSESYTYTSGTFLKENEDGVIYEDVANYEDTVEMSYRPTTAEKSTDAYYSYATHSGLFNSYFWLASRAVDLDSRDAVFYVRYVFGGDVYHGDLFYSGGDYDHYSYSVLPVVYLQSDIQTTGQNANNVWQLK